MKILYFAVHSHIGWGAEWFVNRSMKEMGIDTIPIDYRINKNRITNILLEVNEDFDAVLLQRGEKFPIEILEAINRPKFFWASELVSRRKDQYRMFKYLGFNHFFVRGPNCIKIILEKKWIAQEKISILLSGFDEKTFYKDSIRKDIDVLFVGNLSERRKSIISQVQKNFNVNVVSVFGNEFSNLINRSKIILNIHASNDLDTETRVYEVLGAGGFLLSEKLSDENPFIESLHFDTFTNTEELLTKIKYYLSNDEAREQIAKNGHLEAIAKHSYKKRTEEIVEVMRSKIYNYDYFPIAINKKKLLIYQKKEKVLYRILEIKRIISLYFEILLKKNK